MEKIIWVRSYGKSFKTPENDGLETVNKYLEEGWKVKLISACAVSEAFNAGQAYVVIEKDE